jgi:hypothetical protein
LRAYNWDNPEAIMPWNILGPLTVYAGQKLIDLMAKRLSSGQNQIVNHTNNTSIVSTYNGRTIIDRNFTSANYQTSELIYGNFYIPYSLNEILSDEEIALVLINEHRSDQFFFFTTDTGGYELYLPHGFYSFIVLIIDSEFIDFVDPLDSDIMAIGLPSAIDLSGISDLSLDNYDDIWDFLIDEPIYVSHGGPYYLDFIMLDTDVHPEFPDTLWELFEE